MVCIEMLSIVFVRWLCRVWCILLAGLIGWGTAVAAPVAPLNSVYLYASPITQAFFAANGAVYESMRDRWKEYFRQNGVDYKVVSRASLLEGLKPGVLVMASAILLDDQERKSVQDFANAGGSLLVTWGTGARDAKGHWNGYGFIENLFEMKVTGKVLFEDNERFFNTFGDGPLTWSLPAGERIFFGETSETPLRVDSAFLAARYFNWQRFPTPKNSNGAIAYLEKGNSRRVYLGFAESSWEYDERARLPKALDTILMWLRREPVVIKAAWPNGALSAQLLEMDTEAQFPNALNFARELDAANIRGTFYALTSVAKDNREVVQKLSEKHEIGFHGEVHYGFKGKSPEIQKDRLDTMVNEMKGLVGSRTLPLVTGFRAPTESWDPTTEKLLRSIGVRHHVADPASSESRLPFFSRSEPELGADKAIVVLPRTQMDDLNYLGLKLSIEKASELISLDFDYLHEAGALAVLSVHSQNYAVDGLMAKLTPPYVKRLQSQRQDVWVVSGTEVADWWRIRDRAQFQPGRLLGDRFTFAVQPPGGVKGLTFVVTHPAKNMPVKRLSLDRFEGPIPQLVQLDGYRSALIFKDELKAGSYTYVVEF